MSSDDDGRYATDDSDASVRAEAEAIEALPLLPIPSYVSDNGGRLCDVCKVLNLDANRFVVQKGDEEWGQLNKPDDLTISLGKVEDMKKRTGCPLCRLVLVALGGSKVPTNEDGEPVCVDLSWNTDGSRPDPSAPWNHQPEIRLLRPYARKESGGFVRSQMLNLFPEITLLANDSPTNSIRYFIRPVSQGEIDFAIPRRWLALCDAHHGPACRKNPVLKELERSHPTLEVPSFRCIDVERDCIVVPPVRCQYAALSYTWGPRKFFVTLKNKVKFLANPRSLLQPETQVSDEDQIPPTVKDAMHVAKKLGIKYLWVDTLCIVQDDEDTKPRTIMMMDLIYSAADLVIVAAGSENAYSGIAGVHIGSRASRQPIEQISDGFRLGFKTRWQDSIEEKPYNGRGWTFQETHFATRSLIFIDEKVVFRCQGVDAWEEHRFETPDEIRGERGGRDQPFQDDDIGEFEGLIQTYSERKLSYQEDIYNAFAGVSRQLTVRLGTELCHGIPTLYFDWFLLWGPLTDQTRRDIAPSWSWAGWIGGSFPRIWDWYSPSIERIRKATRKRTWIIWYQRQSHDSPECKLLVRHHEDQPASTLKAGRNFYGSQFSSRFGSLDCSTLQPTDLVLTNARPKTYVQDILSRHPGSGFLQFWTVSLTLRLAESTSNNKEDVGPVHRRRRLGIFGRSGQELGIVSVQATWLERKTLPQEREFILLCEGRDERAEGGMFDDEAGWRYMAMLIEWLGEKGMRTAMGSIDGPNMPMYAERVAIGSIGKEDLKEALGGGPVWKQIILG